MKPAICEKHGAQAFVMTSPILRDALVNESPIDRAILREIHITSDEKSSILIVDAEFLEKHTSFDKKTKIHLKDRSVAQKKMNDRLMIQKVYKDLVWVCPICLSQINQPPGDSVI
ncbi:hypothetical protein [Variovorax rhizosphaerae]|uniref:Uncharacterized protein n=1 Tax=Variovorax rhizosphaerae TaxID=1836200 RepID=A0ABU8WWL4_9BURK